MKKIKWGVLGTADIFAGCTAEGMKEAKNCEMYAIAGRSMAKAENFKEKYGFVKAYDNYETLLEDPEVEAVYIPLPNTLHYEWVMKAVEHKKHVLCEKPLAPTPQMAQEMFDAARKNGVFLMEAFAYQHSPYIAELAKEVKSGIIGDVRYMESAFLTSDYDLSNIRMRKETLGGCTYDLGVYNTSLILRVLGEVPEEIKASAFFSPEGVDKLTTAIMKYNDGKVATFTCGMTLATNQDQRLDRFEIHGTKGKIVSKNFEFNANGKLSYEIQLADGKVEERVVKTPQNYGLEVEQLGRCIQEDETPAVTEEFSLQNAEIIDRILASIGYELDVQL